MLSIVSALLSSDAALRSSFGEKCFVSILSRPYAERVLSMLQPM
jgi:hypothetical protein